MTKHTIFKRSNGEIEKVVDCPNDQIAYQFDPDTHEYILGAYSDETFYIDENDNNQPKTKGNRPSDKHKFDYSDKTWKDDRDLPTRKADKRKDFTTARDTDANAPTLSTPYGTIASGPDNLARLRATIAEMREAEEFGASTESIAWPRTDGTFVTLTRAQLTEIASLAFARRKAAFNKYATKVAAVDAAANAGAVDAITWE